MARGFKMKGKKSKRLFTRTAMRTHKRNAAWSPMRGGFRL